MLFARNRTWHLASWLLGVVGIVMLAWYFQPQDFFVTIRKVGIAGVLGWCLLTLLARWILSGTTSAPLKALGLELSRTDAFWIGWLRTFANQILPFAGIAAYVQALRHKVNISWSELAAMTTPQFVLAGTALGLVGIVAVLLNVAVLGSLVYGLSAAYLIVILGSLVVATSSMTLVKALPSTLAERAAGTSAALRQLGNYPGLIPRIVLYHGSAIILRGARLGILFLAAGYPMGWRELLLLIAISESTLLIQITPGGLGVREGAILAGAALLGVPASIATTVAMIDRLLVILISTLLFGPAVVRIRQARD